MIVMPSLLLGYQPVPKVATTSLINLFYALCAPPAPPGKTRKLRPNAKRNYFNNNRGENRMVENRAEALLPYESYLRFALTRDPVRRFISMYANRVLHHRELSNRPMFAAPIKAAGLPFDPDINVLVERLEAYLPASSAIHHHSRPMMDFLGPDLSVYDRIADISALPELMAEVRSHWVKNGLTKVADECPPLARLQTGGPKLDLGILSPASFEKLMAFYADDYARLPTLDAANIRREYEAAREQAASATAPAIRVRVEPALVRRWVLEARFDKTSAEKGPIGGIVVLSQKAPADLSLHLLRDGESLPVIWGLNSPAVGKRYPNARNRDAARFRALDRPAGGELTLVLIDPRGGETGPIATLRLDSGAESTSA